MTLLNADARHIPLADGVCPVCGAPWRRVVEREKGEPVDVRGYQAAVNQASPFVTHGQGSPNAVAFPNSMQLAPRGGVESRTRGWSPTCTHDAEPVPATVLDPFSGSGTTGVVCRENGRRFVGLDLSYTYLHDLAAPRLRETQPALEGMAI